jgi:cytidylate kinase
MIVTIDGPAGTGKSTVARKVAEKLKVPYFDTGAMYRSVAALLLREQIALTDEKKIAQLLASFIFEIRMSKDHLHYFANNIDVTQIIRSSDVTAIVSAVSALPIVREALWRIQRTFAKKKGGVFEGRDMGSVVFPAAQLKIFLTARPEVRAQRRLAELQGTLTHEQMMSELERRDQIDSTRTLAPLQCPPDAYVIDTSELTLEEVVDRVMEYCQKKNTKSAWMHWRGVSFLYRLVLFLTWIICKVCYRLKIYGQEHFYPRGAILAANHTSFLDPPIVSISWPEVVHFLGRSTLFKNQLFGWFIRKINTHPVSGDVGNIQVIKMVLSLLEEGDKVVLFPEGTRSETGELQPLKPGIGFLVARSKTAVIPVYIHGAYEVWGRKKKFPRPFGKISIVFGSVITWASINATDAKEGQKILSEKIEAAWKALKAWLESGAQGIPP